MVEIILQGYIVPLDSEPPPAIAKNNKSCIRNRSFAVQKLKRLEKLQCVKKVTRNECKIILPISVVFSDKLRLVINASGHINPYVTKRGVKLESSDEFSFLVKKKGTIW